VPRGIPVVQDLTQWEVGDDGDRIFLEVVSQLPRGDQQSV
jgi:hypothetical protein